MVDFVFAYNRGEAALKPPANHPAGPRTPEEATEDERIMDALLPDVAEFVRHIATSKRGRGRRKPTPMTLREALNWCVRYTANRHTTLAKQEANSKCEGCGKKADRCKCPPAKLAAIVNARPRIDDL